MNHTTLTQFKRLQGLDATNTADDALIAMLCNEADQWCDRQRDCKPMRETRSFDYPGDSPLLFGDDLLEVVTLTNGDSTTVASTDYVLRPQRAYPKWAISLKSDVTWKYTTERQDALSVLGVWGYHDDYANAWVTSRDAIADSGGINASVTTITVSDADGYSGDYESPRFQAGQLIKIENEWCDVIAVTAGTTNTLTVVRGVRGTTAEAHATATPIIIWRSARAVQEATMQYIKWRYNQKDNRGANGYTGEIPADITALLPAPLAAYP